MLRTHQGVDCLASGRTHISYMASDYKPPSELIQHGDGEKFLFQRHCGLSDVYEQPQDPTSVNRQHRPGPNVVASFRFTQETTDIKAAAETLTDHTGQAV